MIFSLPGQRYDGPGKSLAAGEPPGTEPVQEPGTYG